MNQPDQMECGGYGEEAEIPKKNIPLPAVSHIITFQATAPKAMPYDYNSKENNHSVNSRNNTSAKNSTMLNNDKSSVEEFSNHRNIVIKDEKSVGFYVFIHVYRLIVWMTQSLNLPNENTMMSMIILCQWRAVNSKMVIIYN